MFFLSFGWILLIVTDYGSTDKKFGWILPQILILYLCAHHCLGCFIVVYEVAFTIGFLLLGLPANIVFGYDPKEVAKIFSFRIVGMLTCAACVLFPLFVGTIYLLTKDYTTHGLVLVFVFLPPVVWPVSYIYLVRSTILIFLLVFMPLTILLTKKMLPLLLTASS